MPDPATVNVEAQANVLGLRLKQRVTAVVNDAVTDALADGYLIDVGGVPSASVVVLPFDVDEWGQPAPPTVNVGLVNLDDLAAALAGEASARAADIEAEQERADSAYGPKPTNAGTAGQAIVKQADGTVAYATVGGSAITTGEVA